MRQVVGPFPQSTIWAEPYNRPTDQPNTSDDLMDTRDGTGLAARAMSDDQTVAYITTFLEHNIHHLTSTDICWSQSGVKGLVTLLRANVSQSAININMPQQAFNVSSSGNTYLIDLAARSFQVNGLTETTYTVLTVIHIFTMAFALFLVYPIILMLEPITVLCDLIGHPVKKHKFKKWELLLESFCFVPLLIAGMVTGILAMGSSDHFRTEHGILGLVTVALAVIGIAIYYLQPCLNMRLRNSLRGMQWLQIIRYIDTVTCQLLLLLSSFAVADGFDDLVVMGLCSINFPMSLTFSFGTTLVFIWNSAMVAMTMEWLLSRRASPGVGWVTRLWRIFSSWRRPPAPPVVELRSVAMFSSISSRVEFPHGD